MIINTLEQAVLERFFIDNNWNIPTNLHNIEVRSREYTGVGFYTEFNKCSTLKVSSDNYIGGKVGAKINSSIDTGYLIYIKDEYIYCIEGYTYEEKWPSEVNSFELYKLP